MFDVLRKLGWFFRAYRWQYTIALTLLFLLNFVEVVPPKLVGYAIDEMSQGLLTPTRLGFILWVYGLLTAQLDLRILR